MGKDKPIKVSEEAHERLESYKEEHGHKSFDSAIREALTHAHAWETRGSDVL